MKDAKTISFKLNTAVVNKLHDYVKQRKKWGKPGNLPSKVSVLEAAIPEYIARNPVSKFKEKYIKELRNGRKI